MEPEGAGQSYRETSAKQIIKDVVTYFDVHPDTERIRNMEYWKFNRVKIRIKFLRPGPCNQVRTPLLEALGISITKET